MARSTGGFTAAVEADTQNGARENPNYAVSQCPKKLFQCCSKLLHLGGAVEVSLAEELAKMKCHYQPVRRNNKHF